MFYLSSFFIGQYNHIIGFRKTNIYYTKKEEYLKILLKDEVINWLLENNIEYVYNDNTPPIYFKNKNDAMLFRLRWS